MPTASLVDVPAPAAPAVETPLLVEIERPQGDPGYLRLTLTLSPKLRAALVGMRGRSTDAGSAGDYESRPPETPGYTAETPTERVRSFRVVTMPGFPFSPDGSVLGRLTALLSWTGWRDLPENVRTVSTRWRVNAAQADTVRRNVEQGLASVRAWIQSTLLAWKVTFTVTTEAL